MKSSQALTVLGVSSQKENKIVIHPNDGFDLGFMALDATVTVYSNTTLDAFTAGTASGVEGKMFLANECKMGTIELGTRYWNRIGKPAKVILHNQDGKVLIQNK